MGYILDERLIIGGDGERNVEEILDEAGYNYDWDSCDRLMINNENICEVIELLEEAGYEVDLI